MISLNQVVKRMIELRQQQNIQLTLLAVCPNSQAVLEAGVKSAVANNMPMLFAATLNQVDRDGGYTGWTAQQFVSIMRRLARRYGQPHTLYPCLDHGGPWLKDAHTRARLSLDETMNEVKDSLRACLQAGYQLLHIDTTVDRTLPPDMPMPIDLVVQRTIELLSFCESERQRLGLPAVSYEVGTEEVHGGLVDIDNFTYFVTALYNELSARNMMAAWPCFIVGKVGTDLHTSYFDPQTAARLTQLVMPLGSLIKGHYTDGVDNPEMYPVSGIGGANVGPEFTIAEYHALADLCAKEKDLCRSRPGITPSHFLETLEKAVYRSGRWEKWLQPDEQDVPFYDLSPARRAWLVQTGARYVWTDPEVVAARRTLYANLRVVMPNPHSYVVDRIATVMDKYVRAFHLFDTNKLLGLT